jgi:hypothetical protein
VWCGPWRHRVWIGENWSDRLLMVTSDFVYEIRVLFPEMQTGRLWNTGS